MTGTHQDPGTELRPAVPADPAPARHRLPAHPIWRWPACGMRAAGRGIRRGTAGAGRALTRWAARPSGRFVLPGLLIAAALAASGSAGAVLVPAAGGRPAVGASPTGRAPAGVPSPPPLALDPATPRGAPTTSGTGAATAAVPQDALTGWAQKLSGPVDIPVVALRAYGYAQLWEQQSQPGCHLAWTTLAGIGKVESDHGRVGGASLQPDGRSYPPIIGPALDGTGDRQRIPDTDHGVLDGDTAYDHAIGPMQFLPATWAQYKIDGDQDGTADPNDINDAAVAAANYLCAGGRDLSTVAGWRSAVLSYNAIQAYLQDVFTAANDYGIASQSVT